MFFSNFNSSCNTKNGDDPFCNLADDDLDHHLPISFFPFPSPFDDQEFDDNLNINNCYSPPDLDHHHHQIDLLPNNSDIIIDEKKMMMMKKKKNIKNKAPRKRLCKKDRHSKITTARGVRDRRMRLSLPVARQFFGLQDMLGVDKGSKTVEWLLIQAKPQILKLATTTTHHHQNNHHFCSIMMMSSTTTTNSNSSSNSNNIKIKNKKKKKMMRSSSSSKQQPIRRTMAKELREKARERARARTLEKKKNILIQNQNQIMNNRDDNYYYYYSNFTKINSSSSWSSTPNFEATTTTGGEESIAAQTYNHHNPITTTSQFDYQYFDTIFPNWSPSQDSTFNFMHHQHAFEDSDIFG